MRVSVTVGSLPVMEVLLPPDKGVSVALMTVGGFLNEASAPDSTFLLVLSSIRTSVLLDTLILYATRSGVSASQLIVTGIAPSNVAPRRNATSAGLLLEKKCTTWSPKPIRCVRRIVAHYEYAFHEDKCEDVYTYVHIHYLICRSPQVRTRKLLNF